MNEFKNYHPLVNFIYFLFVIGFSMFFMHPVCLGLSLFCSFCYSVVLKGKKSLKTNLIVLIPLAFIMAVVNPLFSHEGITIITYLPDGNPLTLESVIYGVCTAVMLSSVIFWFSCYSEVMTSDKFLYLFGKVVPALSLIFSMTLRFVPRFIRQFKIVSNAQRCIGRDIAHGSIIQKAKNGLSIISIMISWSMENAVETADSMKARGFGLPGRTAFSLFRFDKRDKIAIAVILVLGLYILAGGINGTVSYRYFPSVKGVEKSLLGVSVFAAYFMLCVCPLMIEIWEVRRWKRLKSKI